MNSPIDDLNEILEAGDASQLRERIDSQPSLVQLLVEDPHIMCSSASQNHGEIIQLLLELGAPANCEDHKGWMPLHYAAWHGGLDAARALIAHGADLDKRNGDGHTPLFLSLKYRGNEGYAVLGFLLQSGAKLDLLTVVGLRQTHVLACLLRANPRLIEDDLAAKDALSLAVGLNDLPTVELLIKHGANQNISDHYDPPLIAAMSHPYAEAVSLIKFLLEHGADPTIKASPVRPSPLQWAVDHYPSLVSVLAGMRGAPQ